MILNRPKRKVEWRLFTTGEAKPIFLGFYPSAFVLKEPEGRALAGGVKHGYEGDGVNRDHRAHGGCRLLTSVAVTGFPCCVPLWFLQRAVALNSTHAWDSSTGGVQEPGLGLVAIVSYVRRDDKTTLCHFS